ncbi:MAG: hypothetical protein PHE25_06000, partial [Candidatus Gracilibacteria bacterium]|nr:hypothetical protein [Candidatus Gracilibacteria bacterium]
FRENENIWFCNRVGRVKNAYYSFCCFESCEDIYFSNNVSDSKDIYNSTSIDHSSLVYESVRIFDSHHIFFCDDIYNSKNIYFSYDLRDCEECIFCNNLVGKKYMIYNKQYEKGEYNKMKENLYKNTSNHDNLKKLLKDYEILKQKSIRKGVSLIGTEKSVGDQLKNSNDTLFGFWMLGADDCFNSANGFPATQKKAFNSFGFGLVENIYFSMGSGPLTKGFFSVNIESSSDIYFSQKLKGCHHCIGCYGLINADYHILNKAYSKEDYEKNFDKIMLNLNNSGNLNKFYNIEKTPYPLNDSTLVEEFPIKNLRYLKSYNGGDYKSYEFEEKLYNSKGKGNLYIFDESLAISDAILDLGGKEKIKTKWRNKKAEVNIPTGMTVLKYDELPKNIQDIDLSILEKAIICQETSRPFRIIKKELEFYKKHHIALPSLHPDIRIEKRIERKSKIGLYLMNCCKCNKEILSVYDESYGYNLCCEECYNREVY